MLWLRESEGGEFTYLFLEEDCFDFEIYHTISLLGGDSIVVSKLFRELPGGSIQGLKLTLTLQTFPEST